MPKATDTPPAGDLALVLRELVETIRVHPTLAVHPKFDPVMPAKQAAEYCGVHSKTLREDALAGRLASIRRSNGGPVRFRLSDLNAYLEAQRLGPVTTKSLEDNVDWGA